MALARHAQAAGATAVMVSAPYYMGAHVDAVWRHLASVREAVSVPVMLYHVGTTNVELPLEVLRELVRDVIHAVKQSARGGGSAWPGSGRGMSAPHGWS